MMNNMTTLTEASEQKKNRGLVSQDKTSSNSNVIKQLTANASQAQINTLGN